MCRICNHAYICIRLKSDMENRFKRSVVHYYGSDLNAASRLLSTIKALIDNFNVEVVGSDINEVCVENSFLNNELARCIFYKISSGKNFFQNVFSYYKRIWMILKLGIRPDVVLLHVHENRGLLVGAIWSILIRKPIIYETRDLVLHNIDGSVRGYGLLDRLKRLAELIIVKSKNSLIVHVSEPFLDIYTNVYKKPLRQVVIKSICLGYAKVAIPNNNSLNLVYFGRINQYRLPLSLLLFISNNKKINLTIWGHLSENCSTEFRKSFLDLTNRSGDGIRWMGPYAPNKLERCVKDEDFLLLPLDVNVENFSVCLPNKFYQAVDLGLPIITTNLGVLGPIVKDYGIGLVMPDDNWEFLLEVADRKNMDFVWFEKFWKNMEKYRNELPERSEFKSRWLETYEYVIKLSE
jgi:glycosyltransferase involved in cell wall biosynthesis